MCVLIDGIWKDEWYDTSKSAGRFVRWESRYRNWITPDGSPGPTGEGGFAAERGRYHPPRSGKPIDAAMISQRVSNPTYRPRFTRAGGRIGLAS